jgi:hypothetical protein
MEWHDDSNMKLVSGEKAMRAVRFPNFKSGIVIAVAA